MRVGLFALALFLCASLNHQCLAVIQAYEGFDYSNTGSNLLDGYDGGTGWNSPWTLFGTTVPTTADNGHRLSQDNVSLGSAAFPFTPAGDRVVSKGIGPGNNTWADRKFADPFSFTSEGDVRYLSFLFRKDTGAATSEDNMEVDLWSTGVSEPVPQLRFGSTSGELFFFNNTSSPTFEPVTVGQTYFVVLKLESHSLTNDVVSATTYAPTDTVPSAEPTTWDSARPVGLGSTISGIRLWIGVNTTGEYDEIRMGTTWADVAGGPSFPPGDFNKNGTVDAADYVVWRKNASGQFTEQDYQLWRQNFGTSSGVGAAASVPEPGAGVAVVLSMVFVLNRCVGSRRLSG